MQEQKRRRAVGTSEPLFFLQLGGALTAFRAPFLHALPELLALFLGEDLVHTDLGGVHLALNSGLELGLAVEKGVEERRLIAFALHEVADAVAHGLVTLAERVETLA